MGRGVSWIVLLAITIVLGAGCGGAERVPVYPVSGRVSINGKPPEGWAVMLHLEPAPPPNGPYPHPLPRATVGPDGRFQFRTYEKNDGAPAGTYKVSFVDMKALYRSDPEERDGREKTAKDEKSPQVYWPTTIEIRPEANELPPFEIKNR